MDFLHPPSIPILVASCLIIVVDLRKSEEAKGERKKVVGFTKDMITAADS